MRRVIFLIVVSILFFGCQNPIINSNQFVSITLDNNTTIYVALEKGSIHHLNKIADDDTESYCTVILENGFASLLISNASGESLNFNFSSNSEVTYNIYSEYRYGSSITRTNLFSDRATSLNNTYSGASPYNYYYIHLRCLELAYINIYNFSYN